MTSQRNDQTKPVLLIPLRSTSTLQQPVCSAQTMKQLKAKLTHAKDKVIDNMHEGDQAATAVLRRAAQVRISEEERVSGTLRLSHMTK
jgi:hypothetical protein